MSNRTGRLVKWNDNEYLYSFDSPNDLKATEYKVMHSQDALFLVSGKKLLFNEKLQIYYLPKASKNLSDIFKMMDSQEKINAISWLFAAIAAVRDNGFLKLQNIVADSECIFVDSASERACLIYIPSEKGYYASEAEFEEELKSSLVSNLASGNKTESAQIIRIIEKLSDKRTGLNELISLYSEKPRKKEKDKNEKEKKILFLKSILPALTNDILINKEQFLIGRKAEDVDGLVTGSMRVGRIHCQIDTTPDGFTITDLDSSNGSMINGRALRPMVAYLLKNGDTVSIADMDFTVQI